MKWLEEIHKLHSKWVAIAHNFGVNNPEDTVQDFYIELIATSKRKFKPNDKRFNPDYANLDFKDKVLTDGKINQRFVFLIFRRVIGAAHQTQKKEGLQILGEIKDQPQEEDEPSKESIYIKLDDILDNCYWYDKMMLETYIKTGYSMRKLAEETGITYRSVNHSITKIKGIIKEELKETYQKHK